MGCGTGQKQASQPIRLTTVTGKLKITITSAQDIINQGLNHPQVTMSTLIIICNSNAKLTSNGKVLTPRGYLNKYELDGELKA